MARCTIGKRERMGGSTCEREAALDFCLPALAPVGLVLARCERASRGEAHGRRVVEACERIV